MRVDNLLIRFTHGSFRTWFGIYIKALKEQDSETSSE